MTGFRSVQGARRPTSYDVEPCEGKQASPSNPTNGHPARASSRDDTNHNGKTTSLGACVVFRCSESEKALLLSKAERAGVRLSTLMREALGIVSVRRRRVIPKADPALLREVGRIGGNLNQIARWLNTATAMNATREIDALTIATRLVAIERAVRLLSAGPERVTSDPDQPPC